MLTEISSSTRRALALHGGRGAASGVSWFEWFHDHALAAARFPGTGAARRLQRLALEGTHWLRWERSDRVAGPV
jgi:hypothetical protein